MRALAGASTHAKCLADLRFVYSEGRQLHDYAALQGSEPDFLEVTELAGTPISGEQLNRLYHRYAWAAQYCKGQHVAELACGTGPGLGLLSQVSASVEAGDCSAQMLDRVRKHYGERVALARFDAIQLPYADASKDVLIIFEAIYYLSDVGRFIAECKRVLTPGGKVLVATANKDLPDFNPSPFSRRYLGVSEFKEEFASYGFSVQCFGYLDTKLVSWRQRVLTPIKRVAVSIGLMPRTMRGKQLLKRLVFGRLVLMPAELGVNAFPYVSPTELSCDRPDDRHKVIYCVATLQDGRSSSNIGSRA